MTVPPAPFVVPESEIDWSYARAGGPGGQNVNKVSSKATLRWNVETSPSLVGRLRERFMTLYGRRLTKEGDLLIVSQRFRDQERNREDCREKLAEMMTAAAT
ncbi:MAG: alternative ribosome rescue aminoacyl-tRNA hydrolase ArfB, partial [Planctomycetia bacterium]